MLKKWEKDGLFKPKSSPRDLSRVIEPINEVFKVPETIFDAWKKTLVELV